jgi:hypothetical protein
MNEQLSTLLTPENVLSYADACIQMCDILIDLQKNGYYNIVIPSRGVYPFYYHSGSVYYALKSSKFDYSEFRRKQRVWLLPFTSDWGNASLDTSSYQSRRFWVKVLHDVLNKHRTPFTYYYQCLARYLGPRYNVNIDKVLPSRGFLDNVAEGIVFMDTVVSGRAISEIIQSFHEFNIRNYFLILMIDANGEKLEPAYASVIYREQSAGKAKLIFVKKIFTEDASPLLNSGICSMVFPSLMEDAVDQIPEFKHNNLTGGGLWFINAVTHLYGTDLNAVNGIGLQLINDGIRYHLRDDHEHFDDKINSYVEIMQQVSKDVNLFDQASTKEIFENRLPEELLTYDTIDISSSHVIRVDLSGQYRKSFMRLANRV